MIATTTTSTAMGVDYSYPRFSDAEYTRRYTDVRAEMARANIDALVLFGRGTSPEIHYLSNWQTTTEAVLIFPSDGEATLLVQLSNHLPVARRMAVISDVRFGGSNSTGAVDSVPTLVDNLLERGLDRARLGMVGPVSHQYYTRLQAALPDVEWVDFSNKLRDQRQIKSVEEIERFKISAALSDASVAALAAQARPGITEHELARIVENAYLGEGGVNAIHFMITTPMDAPRGGVPQQYLTDRVLQSGDVLVTEISTNYWGYSAQILRTFAIDAEPTPAYQKLHDVALEAFYRIAAVIKDGTGIEEILDAAESVAEHGFTIYDDLLHGANQLPPILRTRQTYRGAPPQFQFRENMCLVIQPNVVTADGLMGVQVGDMLRVTKTGLEPLHTYPRELIVCRAGTSTQAY